MGSLWPRSGTIERYADDIRAAGAKAYFFQGGTTTPLTVYSNSGEGESHPRPVLADASGRWPNIFIPYSGTGYDVQVKTADDVQLTYTVSVPNPDPIAVVAPPAVDGVTTGMIHAELANSTKSGYVRLNGRTIGNASSGGTERANADTSNLFSYLWNGLSDTIAPVSGGRGASSVADYAANKSIVLPSCRGTALVGLDDMGNSPAGLFSAQSFAAGHSAIIQGSACGSNTRTLSIANMPAHAHTASSAAAGTHNHGGATNTEAAHTHTGTTGTESATHTHFGFTDTAPNHTHSYTFNTTASAGAAGGGNLLTTATSGTTGAAGSHSHSFETGDENDTHTHSFTSNAGSAHSHTINSDGSHSHIITVDSVGGGAAVDNMGNARLVTWYIKL